MFAYLVVLRNTMQRSTAIFVGAALVALPALIIDFIAALAERYLRPKGI